MPLITLNAQALMVLISLIVFILSGWISWKLNLEKERERMRNGEREVRESAREKFELTVSVK